jgi:hypothetical protein
MLVTIDVTEEDINAGCARDARWCMVARAVNRVIDSHCDVRVSSIISLYSKYPNSVHKVNLEDWVVDKINQFDNWKSANVGPPSTPFSFEVDIPVEYLEMEVPTPEVLVKETVTC